MDSDLYYLRARYYDPSIGRFLGRDPLPAQNLYAYVGNNPTNWIDPSGLRTIIGEDERGHLVYLDQAGGKEGGNFDDDTGRTGCWTVSAPAPPPPPGGCEANPNSLGCNIPTVSICNPESTSMLDVFVNIVDPLQEAWSTVMTALSSECGQGIGMILVGSASLLVAATGVGALAESGGIVIYSAGATATSAAAAGAAAGPQNVQNVITYLPRGFVQVANSCR